MKKEDIEHLEKEWKIKKDLLERQLAVKQEKQNLKQQFKKSIPTSKLLILFLFINCSLIEIFTGWVTIQSLMLAGTGMITPDFTPLVTLIGAVVSEVIGFAIYALKSAKENSVGGIIYETAMAELNQEADG